MEINIMPYSDHMCGCLDRRLIDVECGGRENPLASAVG